MYALIGTWRMCLDGARAGLSGLKAGGSAGDAVEKAIIDVEDRPEFVSVGYGGLPDRSGHVMLDAAFMDGGTLRMGGVMSVEISGIPFPWRGNSAAAAPTACWPAAARNRQRRLSDSRHGICARKLPWRNGAQPFPSRPSG
jgi:hypothetical protein